MNNNYRLQLRHGDEAKNFVTRHDVFKHINGQLQYGGVSLLPYEPVLFYYGEEGDKNAIIMVGLPEGETHHDKSYFIIDTAELKAQIEALDTKYDDAIKSLQEEDGKLWDAINKEVEDRIAADEAEAQARSEKDTELENAIADEAEARTKADELLQEAIDFTKADLMSVVDACGLIYNDKLSEDRVSYEPDSHDEVIRDSKDIADAIDKISKFAAKLGKDLKIAVANTDTVNLTIAPNEKDGGSIITADVNIAETDGKSKEIFDNNIIGKTSEGIYASVSLVPSKKSPNKLIFKTSGYVNGKFVVDAFETEVDLFTYNGDSGKNTGVNVIVDNEKNLISAELILSSDKNNILKLEDGEYVVEGVAKNIKYGETTVAGALKNQANRISEIEDEIEYVKAVEVKGSETSTSVVNVEKSTKGDFTVSSDVKLSNDRSIIIANGGLKANVSASFREGTSTLIITVGDNEYSINLSALAVSVLEKAEYDSVTEEIVLTFRVGDSLKTLRVPVGSLIHDMEVDDTDTIDLTLTSVSGGPNRLSAVLKVDKAHGDNILTVNSNGAYVSKSLITEAVKEESDARKDADKELKNKLDEVNTLANTNKEAIAEEANVARAAEKANANAIAQEIKDARAAEKANADAIANNEAAISENAKTISNEVTRATKAEEANADAIIAEENRAKAAEVKNENAIASEIDRATEKEADLLNEISNSNVKIKENKDAITAEVDRATKAEKTLNDSVTKNTSDIASEVIRAKAAEETNKSAIETEVSRAKTAEGELATDIAKNTTAVTDVKTLAEQNKVDLATEITRAKAAEEANKTAIETEETRAMAAEGVLTAKVTKNTSDIEAVNTAITTEASRAAAAEAELTTKLTDEVTRAKAAEAANGVAIANENARAIEKENDLYDKVNENTANIATNTGDIQKLNVEITGEIARAKAAEEANKTAIDTEKGRAEHAEGDLLNKIQENTENIQTLTNEVGNIELKKEGDLSYALYVNGTKHGEFTIPKDQFLKSVNYNASTKELVFVFNTTSGDVTTTISIADLIDTYTAGNGLVLNGNVFSVDFTNVASVEAMQAAVNAEVARAKAAEEANKTAIETEVGRATTAEAAIIEQVNTNVSNITKNASDIVAEAARAKAAEGVISSDLSTETTRAKAAEEANKTAIDTEVGRATTAETTLSEKINSEITRATEVESGLRSDVTKNASDIATEAARAKAAESDLTTKLTNEITRATGVETANTNAITAEISRAKDAEGGLLEKINANVNAIQAITTEVGNIELKKEGDLSYALYVNGTKHGEFTIPKDQFLKSVNYNASTKELVFVFNTSEGETTTTISIADLVDTYTAGDGLQLNGNTFSVDFTNVASVEAMQAAVNAEVARAKAAEELLNSNVVSTKATADDAKVVADKAASDLANEITRATGVEAANANAIENEKARAIVAEEGLDTKVSEAKGVADKAASDLVNTEKNLTKAISDEVSRAQLSESAISGELTAEIDRAKEAEDDLKEAISEQNNYTAKVESDLNNHITLSKNELKTVKDELTSTINTKADAANVYTKAETLTQLEAYAKVTDVQSALNEKVNTVEADGKYATKEALQDVKDTYATKSDVEKDNEALSIRITNNEEAIDAFNLTYNPATSVLVYTDKKGVEHEYQLYSGSLVKKGDFDTRNNSIVLTIETAGVESQITIPVSDLLSEITKKVESNTTEIQNLNESISKLGKDWDTTTSSSVELVKTTVGEKDNLVANVRLATSNKQAIKNDGDGLYVSNDLEDFTCVFGGEGVISGQDAISKLLEKINNDGLADLKKEIESLKATVSSQSTEISNLKAQVATYQTQIESINTELGKVKQVTAYDTYPVGKDNIPTRIDNIETELAEMVDAGEY